MTRPSLSYTVVVTRSAADVTVGSAPIRTVEVVGTSSSHPVFDIPPTAAYPLVSTDLSAAVVTSAWVSTSNTVLVSVVGKRYAAFVAGFVPVYGAPSS